MKSLWLGLIATTALLLLNACADESASIGVSAPIVDSFQQVEIVAKEYELKPKHVRVKVGTPVRLTIKAEDTPHSLRIEGLLADTRVPARKSVTVEFTPDKTGQYKMLCAISNHEILGMRGTLIVED